MKGNPICKVCLSINQRKLFSSADLLGQNALVTGGRTKIGQKSALRLLRCGANVFITTRFPMLCASRFKQESDSQVWWDRLKILAIDLRDIKEVLKLCQYFKSHVTYLHILINNAAQTIQKPAPYFKDLVQKRSKKNMVGIIYIFYRLPSLVTPSLVQDLLNFLHFIWMMQAQLVSLHFQHRVVT